MAPPQTTRWFILPVILAGLLCCGTSKADAPAPLPGHYAKLDEAVKHCQGALVATFEKVESTHPGHAGLVNYETRWKVNQVLRGNYPPETTLSMEVMQAVPKPHAERLPTVNKTYIVIQYGPENNNQIAIVLENTGENLKKVSSFLKP